MKTKVFGLVLFAMFQWLQRCEGGKPEAKSDFRMSVTYDNKVAIHPKDGDTVRWKDMVTFGHYSPCKGHENDTGYKTYNCEVTVKEGTAYGHYRYSCGGCTDPEIVVGSDDSLYFDKIKPKPANVHYVYISCGAGNTIKPDPTELSVTMNETIQWDPDGGLGQYPKTWTVTWDGTPPTCTEGPINQGQRECTISGASAEYKYTVTSTDPACSGMGSVKLQ
jgi:hypothetical protein